MAPFGFKVAFEFRQYVRGHLARTIESDSPIRLTPLPTANLTQNVDRISRLIRAGLSQSVQPELFCRCRLTASPETKDGELRGGKVPIVQTLTRGSVA